MQIGLLFASYVLKFELDRIIRLVAIIIFVGTGPETGHFFVAPFTTIETVVSDSTSDSRIWCHGIRDSDSQRRIWVHSPLYPITIISDISEYLSDRITDIYAILLPTDLTHRNPAIYRPADSKAAPNLEQLKCKCLFEGLTILFS